MTRVLHAINAEISRPCMMAIGAFGWIVTVVMLAAWALS